MIKLCCPVLGIDPESNSGGGVHDRELLKALAKEGAELEILMPKNRSHDKDIKNWHIEYTPITHIFPPYLFNIFVVPYLFKKYKEGKFNCIRVFNPYFAGPAIYLFKLFHQEIPIVANYNHLEESIVKKFIDRLLINKWEKIVAISDFTKKEIIDKYHVPEEKIEVSYIGVEENKYCPKKRDEKLIDMYSLKDKTVLLFLGGLKKRKNVGFLIDLVKEIKEKNVTLLICGSGEEELELKEKVKSLDLKNQVKFSGFVKEDQKNEYYNLADIVLFPTSKEGFGLLPLEAGLCGKPTIASRVASVPEVVVDGITGLLATFNDKKDWLIKINSLIENKNLAEKLGNNALSHSLKMQSEKFNWSIIAKKYLKLFRSFSEEKKP